MNTECKKCKEDLLIESSQKTLMRTGFNTRIMRIVCGCGAKFDFDPVAGHNLYSLMLNRQRQSELDQQKLFKDTMAMLYPKQTKPTGTVVNETELFTEMFGE